MSIQYRYFIKLECKLASPLLISSGLDETTDADLIRNGQDELFIPGSSIAGAIREYLKDKSKKMMGFSDVSGRGKMSSLLIEDAFFKDIPQTSIRDSIKLDDNKIVSEGSKFDFEIIDTGAMFNIFMEYVQRDGDSPIDDLAIVLKGFDSGEIRLGGKKSRGYGRISIENAYKVEFNDKQISDYLEFLMNPVYKDAQKWDYKQMSQRYDYMHISVPLKQCGGISIRRYSATPNEADFEHVTSNQLPVIPGTSWNGAVRARLKYILQEIGYGNFSQKCLDEWFGYVKGNEALKSLIIFGESIIKDATKITISRNSIDRFDASTKDGALYTETSYFNGTTELEMMIEKNNDRHYKALVGMIELIMDDIQDGYLAIGGQTSIGRGIFEADHSKSVDYSGDDLSNAQKELVNYLEELSYEDAR